MSALLNTQIRRFPSPLRYPGGKGKVANFMKLVFLANDLVGHEYVEPYAGGASVALSLLYEDYASHIHINDLDPAVFAFWAAVLDQTDDLCKRIRDTKVTVAEWERQRAVQSAKAPEPLDLAFSTFFMNRTNRSGIITGGIIGGRDQTGNWKLDARYNRDDLIRRINKVARFSSRITLTCQDALEFLDTWCLKAEDAFVYLDPPYFQKGGDLYRNYYEKQDHEAVAATVDRLKVPWIVSYDADPAVLSLYASRRSVEYSLSYSAAQRVRGSEVMFFASGLQVPVGDSPACVPGDIVDAALLAQLVDARIDGEVVDAVGDALAVDRRQGDLLPMPSALPYMGNSAIKTSR